MRWAPTLLTQARWLWLALPLVGWLELGAHFHTSRAAPSSTAWRAVRPAVAELRQQQELIVIAPAWADPLARHAFGDQLMPLQHIARADESTFPHALEVSILGQHSPLLTGWPVEQERRVGDFLLQVRRNPQPQTRVFDFVEQLGPQHAKVFVGPRDARQACPWQTHAAARDEGPWGYPSIPHQRFSCPGNGAFFVGVAVIGAGPEFRPRRCIWAHPNQSGQLSVHFNQVPLGQRIRGYGQRPQMQERQGVGPPTRLQVTINANQLGSYVHRAGESWKYFDFPLGKYSGQRADVTFELHAPPTKHRYFCFQVDTR